MKIDIILVQDALNEFAYDAELAGLSYSLSSTTRSLKLHLGGYNSKLPVLADAICKKLMNFVVRDDRFAIYKEQLLRSYHNFDKEQPYQHAMYHLSLMLESDRYHRVDKINALQHASPDDLRAHLPELLRHLFIDVLAHGNMTASQATEFAQRLQSTLAAKPLHPTLRTDRRMVQLSPKEYVNARSGYNIDDPNSAVVVYWQAGRYSVEQRARLDLFAQIVQEPCFNQLRTQEQLGYLVWSGIQDDTQYHVLGFRVIVQSAERSALYLDQRIDAFIDSIDRLLSEMSEEQFSQFRDSAVSEKLEKDKNLSEESSRHWRRIEDGTLDFDRGSVLSF
jgi:insulysin